MEAAEQRRAVIEADLAKLRPRVDLDADAADKYQDLIAERGQLDIVLASAQRAIAQ